MSQLGTLEDLPKDYRDSLSGFNLQPLWPNLRELVRPKPGGVLPKGTWP